MGKNKIILSFDYELFFGDKSGTVENSLIKPTYLLLECMEKAGFRGTFFVDWQMLKYLKETGTDRTINDYNLIVKQLKDIVKRGHRIELHIHPHWVDAKYNGDGTWNFDDFSHYSLQSFSQQEVTQMFEEGINVLTSIAHDVDPFYRIVAFRAGGWAVQPFDLLREAFNKTGLMIDSSVAHGMIANNGDTLCDFSEAPNKDYYRFENDVLHEDTKGHFLEVPITVVQKTFIARIIDKLCIIFSNYLLRKTDGTHVKHNASQKTNKDVKKKKPIKVMLSFSSTHPFNILMYTLGRKHSIYCFIDHPKDFSCATIDGINILKGRFDSMSYIDFL